jgi:hypothetical protein
VYDVYKEDAVLGGYSGSFDGTLVEVHSSEGDATGDFLSITLNLMFKVLIL